ncbi:MAG: hypothetical protein V1888_01610 [archaeon]
MSDSISRAERHEDIRKLEAEMFWGLLGGVEKGVIYGKVSEVGRKLDKLGDAYFGVKARDKNGFPVEYFSVGEGLENLMFGLMFDNVDVWEKALGCAVENYSDLPWHDSAQLDVFEKFLDLAPEGVDRKKYESEVNFNRELIKRK